MRIRNSILREREDGKDRGRSGKRLRLGTAFLLWTAIALASPVALAESSSDSQETRAELPQSAAQFSQTRQSQDLKRRRKEEKQDNFAPQAEPGYVVRQLPGGGYMRFAADDGDSAGAASEDLRDQRGAKESRDSGSDDQGGIIVLVHLDDEAGAGERAGERPLEEPVPSRASARGDAVSESEGAENHNDRRFRPRDARGRRGELTQNPEPRCFVQRAALAQRLLKLRGLELPPAEALFVLESSEQQGSPALLQPFWGNSPLLPGGSELESALSHDALAKDRLSELIQCLQP